jgi:hypothetical protein
MKSSFLIAAMLAAATASAQSSLLLPNNSAGTEMDTPPVLPADARTLEPAAKGSDAPLAIDERKLRDRETPAANARIPAARAEPDEPEALRERPHEAR